MCDHQEDLFDLDTVFSSVGECAMRSIRDFCMETVDLSEWLCMTDNKMASEIDRLPHCPCKEFLEKIFLYHDHITWDAIFPTFDQLKTLEVNDSIELSDLLITTTILSPLIERMYTRERPDQPLPIKEDPPTSDLSRRIIFWDRKCALTLDSVTRSLIPSIAYLAKKLDLRIDRSKRRRTEGPPKRALDPAVRVKYVTFSHRPKSQLLDRLRGTTTPIYDLAELIGEQPCVFQGPYGPAHAVFARACEILEPLFENEKELLTLDRISDQHEITQYRW